MSLEVRNSKHGLSVYTDAPLRTGSTILTFGGPLLKLSDIQDDHTEHHSLQIGADLYLGPSGGPDDSVNHCCDPNAGVRWDSNKVVLVAVRDIAEGEEVTFDYSTVVEEPWRMRCSCEAPNCRRTVVRWSKLPFFLKSKYRSLGVAFADSF